jgi:protein SHQ1
MGKKMGQVVPGRSHLGHSGQLTICQFYLGILKPTRLGCGYNCDSLSRGHIIPSLADDVIHTEKSPFHPPNRIPFYFLECGLETFSPMLTPKFTIEQTHDFIHLKLHCPYIKATEVEIDITGTEFRFYCRPYFLRLHLPGSLVENGKERSRYDIDSGIVSLDIPKEIPGQEFVDLDLLTKLLDVKPVETKKPGPMIESMEEHYVVEVEDEELDWHFQQTVPATGGVDNEVLSHGVMYGFNNLYQGFGSHVHELAKEILDVRDVDTSTPQSRREDRLQSEELKLDEEYYLYDTLMNEEIPRLLQFTPESWKALSRIQTAKLEAKKEGEQIQVQDPYLDITPEESEKLVQLPNKSYLVDEEMKPRLYLGLVDILFAFCYNHRTTEGESTVESAWTICKLSGTLSALDTYASLQDVLVSCLRRSLCFPLYRTFALFQKVVQDVVVLLKLGKRAILKAFLEIKMVLEVNETMYLMDRIFITDYCIWIQKASEKHIKSLASELHHYKTTKAMSGWDLEEWEQQAQETT